MSDSYFTIIPKLKEVPDNKTKAAQIVDWLVSENFIRPELTDCVLSATHGYAIGKEASKVVNEPEYLPYDLTTNGLEVVTELTVFHSGQFTDEEDVENLPESDLGFTFWNWPEPTPAFVEEFKNRLGYDVEVIIGRI